ncbi:hypothetical protein LguiA_019776 [Lonicera macranthoides]
MECDDGSSSGRRMSSRIQNMQAVQARKRENSSRVEQMVVKKKMKVCQKKKAEPAVKLDSPVVENGGSEEIKEVVVRPKEHANGGGGSIEAMDMDLVKVAEEAITEKSAYARVIDTIRTFNTQYLHFVQEEEKRCGGKDEVKKGQKTKKQEEKMSGKVEVNAKKKKGRKTKKKVDAPEEDSKNRAKRPDLKALKKMRETNAVLFPKTRIGNIPGIDVGHKFFSRVEMVVVGFHNHWLSGIDFIGGSGCKVTYGGYKLPLSVAIVISGQYEDDVDNCEDVVYTGQGGNNLLGNKRQVSDQVMERGNLGLKHAMEQGVPVRVIRGHQCKDSYVGKVYTYDGLYKVDSFWAEKGISGFTVYKFRLKRLEGQSCLTTEQVHFARVGIPKSVAEIRGLVCEDIAQGKECLPIPATNLIDDPPVAPTGFTYINSVQVSKSVKLPVNAPGCNCCKGEGSCKDPNICACARLNGSDFPYVHKDGGRLIEAKDVVFECGPNCGCGPDCVNRTSQRGLKHRLEVFKTPNKGWAVRSWDTIRSGAVVCEYMGVLRKTDDLDTVTDNSYIFDIDCLQTIKGLDGRERRLRDVSISHLVKEDDKDSVPEFCIDAGSTGNVARFINHSCQPNLFVQCVLSDHHDMKLARVILFAADNIPALKELTYDYGYVLDSVIGADGKIKKMPCYCGAADCRKRLY